MDLKIIKNLLVFYQEAEKLKVTLRHGFHDDTPPRQESSADHSWMLGLIAMTLIDHLSVKVDKTKVFKMIIVHDLAEAVTGDIPAFEVSDRKTNKKQTELAAMQHLVRKLPERVADDFLSLWHEYEERKTPEAQFVQAVDKLESTMQHNNSDLAHWSDGDYSIHPYHKNDYFDFDPVMRQLKDEVENQSREKITKGNMIHRLRPEFQKLYHDLNNKDTSKRNK